MNYPRLYFPELRPDDYFKPGNIIYKNNTLGIESFKITEKKDVIFYCIDQKKCKRHAFTYKNPEILSPEEVCHIKNLISDTEIKFKKEDCTPEQIYETLSKEVKNSNDELILFFHRLEKMFRRRQNRVKSSINLIRQIKNLKI